MPAQGRPATSFSVRLRSLRFFVVNSVVSVTSRRHMPELSYASRYLRPSKRFTKHDDLAIVDALFT